MTSKASASPGMDIDLYDLNEAYTVLSDPSSRSAYDKEHGKVAELKGYTGRPIYSVWFGSETEERAAFVDEVKCVGCLKCALFAEKTFSIESVYGRARVVAQWADPEHKIQEAIDTCPVYCISLVERSNLAALEFSMSKQPRGNVRVGMGNVVGTGASNIFADVKKFQTRFEDTKEKASTQHHKIRKEKQECHQFMQIDLSPIGYTGEHQEQVDSHQSRKKSWHTFLTNLQSQTLTSFEMPQRL